MKNQTTKIGHHFGLSGAPQAASKEFIRQKEILDLVMQEKVDVGLVQGAFVKSHF